MSNFLYFHSCPLCGTDWADQNVEADCPEENHLPTVKVGLLGLIDCNVAMYLNLVPLALRTEEMVAKYVNCLRRLKYD